jgi:Ca2+-binding RTX toxin-like protein
MLAGGLGSDTLFGDGGNDILYAANHFTQGSPDDYDVLDGGDGDDGLIGGAGINLMFGGAGNDYFRNGTGNTIAYGGEGNDTFLATANGYSEFYGEAGNDILRGGIGQSYLDGGEGDDLLIGGAGVDTLVGGPENDIFEAFQNDLLKGGEGDDIYKFWLGGGANAIVDSEGANQIVLYSREIPNSQTPILRESIRFSLEGDQYRISYGNPGDSILLGAAELATLSELTLRHLTGYEYAINGNGDPITIEICNDESIPFAQSDLLQRGSDSDDYLVGDAAFSNTLDGKAGNDVLIGSSGGDNLIGGPGDDILIGGAGDDAYYFSLGSGHDVVIDQDTAPNNCDTVMLGGGITEGDVSVLCSTDQLTLVIAGADDRLDIQWLPQEGYAIEGVQFAGGTVWDQAMLERVAVPVPQSDVGTTPISSGGEPAGGGQDSGTENSGQVGIGSASAIPNSQPASLQSQRDALAAAVQSSGVIDSPAAPAQGRNPVKAADAFGAGLGGGQVLVASGLSSLPPAWRPAQPSLQNWLDNWLGPGGRASRDTREESQNERQTQWQDGVPSLNVPDFDLPSMPSDAPDANSSERLTPEQITQRYQEIDAWLDANPGIEQDIVGGSGALPEGNLFAYASAAGESGFASIPGFGQSPGMAALGGAALKPLQGVNEGYAHLGLV